MSQQLQTILDAAWEDRANISIQSAPKEVADAVEHVIAQLNNGTLRVATRDGVGQWTTHQWIKKAVLLSFRLKDNRVMKSGDLRSASGRSAARKLRSRWRNFDAFVRQHRRVCRFRHDGGHLGYRRFMRTNW
jgi:tetrahydrodipicolinate N-succinyltransferase